MILFQALIWVEKALHYFIHVQTPSPKVNKDSTQKLMLDTTGEKKKRNPNREDIKKI
jgi:hypothetical protein